MIVAGGIRSIGRLALAVGRSKTAVSGWIKRDDWPFAAAPPWCQSDVPAMLERAAENLRPDYAAESRDSGARFNRSDRFWEDYVSYFPINIRSDDIRGEGVADALEEPAEICTPFERDILSGKRNLSPSEVRDLVAMIVRYRAAVARDLEDSAEWLTGCGCNEIRMRSRAIAYDRLGWFAQTVGGFANDKSNLGQFSVEEMEGNSE